MKPQSKKLIWFLKLLLGIGFIALIIHQVSLQELRTTFSNVEWLWVGIVGIGVYGTILISIYRWQYLLQPFTNTSYVLLYKFFFIGLFFSTFLPTNFGGDGIRTWYLKKEEHIPFPESLAATFMERFTGLLSVIILLLIGMILNWQALRQVNVQFYVLTIVIACTSLTGVFFIPRVQILIKKICTIHTNTFTKKLSLFLAALRLYTKNMSVFIVGLVLSLFVNTTALFVLYVSLLAFHTTPSVASLFIIVPLSYLISIIPLTPNGLGVTEGVFVLFFSWFGVAAGVALGAALIFRFVRIFFNSIGFFHYLSFRPTTI